MALPAARFALIESASRKCDVIERLALAAGLHNVDIVAQRAEDHARDAGARAYDVVLARAVAALPVLVEYASPLLGRGGTLVAWKGKRDAGEESAGAAAAEMTGMEPARVCHVTPFPGSRDRHLHVYRKTRETPERFPRRAGMARKRPLA